MSINRNHLTSVKVKRTDIPVELKTMDALLALYDDSPADYAEASRVLSGSPPSDPLASPLGPP